MKKYLPIFLFMLCLNLNAQSILSGYFTMGSTENTVLQIQGEPTSVSKYGNSATFYYGSSTVTFKNGLVDGYQNNAGNLKIKMVSSVNNVNKNVTTNKNSQSKPAVKVKKEEEKITYVYFTYFSINISVERDFFGNLKSPEMEYSDMFGISGYTKEKLDNLEFCLTKQYKDRTGKEANLLPNIFSDKQSMLSKWNSEKGSKRNLFFCDYLMQSGIWQF